ncbi:MULTISPECIES: dihydroneopterin aldolase [unclassified Thioalkalivibrio]|uniref:dihydroneopterin aldolase n=1 Tax=unclassified Thioalkalivibrio TaxID=2621013 RepID=UPI0003620F37|nr:MULTISPECIES: dihydroneopterin aldolase [unclassified Thioalkalivibrio]
MDRIYLKDLRIDAVVGVYDWEQRIQRPLRFDIQLATDTRIAAHSGEITDTVDYEAVANAVRAIVTREPHALLESLAEEIAEALMAEFRTPWVRIELGKPGAVAGVAEVGIVVERGTLPAST